LGENQAFELVFWSTNDSTPRAVNGDSLTSNNFVRIRPSSTGMLSPGEYQWGVYLAWKTPYARIQEVFGLGGSLTISGAPGDKDDESDAEIGAPSPGDNKKEDG
jgi:hypothetical protein